jgi:HEAT repeat protein
MEQSNRSNTGDEPSLGSMDRRQDSGQEPRVGGDRALLHLAEMLQHTDPDVRIRAAFALAELGDERALAHLLRIMQDSTQHWNIRERAAYSIGPIGQAAVPHLLSLLYTDWNIYGKHPAAIGLGAIVRYYPALVEAIAPALIEALNSPLLATRVAAVQSMGRMRNPIFTRPLLDVLSGERSRIGDCAAEALGMIGEKARTPEVLDVLFERLLGERTEHSSISLYADALARIGDPITIPRALRLIEQGEGRIANIIDQLVEGFRETATPYLLDGLDRIDNSYRPLIIAALGFTRDRRATEALLEMLDSEVEYRAIIIEALGMLRDPLAIPKLTEWLNSQKDPHLVTRILWALSLIGDPATGAELLEYLESHTDGNLFAIRMLGEIKYVPAVPCLIDRLSIRSVRSHAIVALVRIGTPEALSALAGLVSQQEIATIPENLDPAALDAIEALRAGQNPARKKEKGHHS